MLESIISNGLFLASTEVEAVPITTEPSVWEKLTGWLYNNIAVHFANMNIWMSALIAVVIVAGIIWFIVVSKKMKWQPSIIAEIAIAAALSLILGFFKVYRMPEGGSVSLAMLPVLFVALRRGVVPGVTCGIIAGFLQMIPDPFLVHPFQIILDYPMAWGAIGLAGLFVDKNGQKMLNWIIGVFIAIFAGLTVYGITTNVTSSWFGSDLEHATLGWDIYVFLGLVLVYLIPSFFIYLKGFAGKVGAVCLATFGRFFFHFLSGIFFFWMFITAWEGFTLFGYVSIYISLHLIPEAILAIIASIPIMRRTTLLEAQQ